MDDVTYKILTGFSFAFSLIGMTMGLLAWCWTTTQTNKKEERMTAKTGTVVGFSNPPREVHVRIDDPLLLKEFGYPDLPRLVMVAGITDPAYWATLQIGSKVELYKLALQ